MPRVDKDMLEMVKAQANSTAIEIETFKLNDGSYKIIKKKANGTNEVTTES